MSFFQKLQAQIKAKVAAAQGPEAAAKLDMAFAAGKTAGRARRQTEAKQKATSANTAVGAAMQIANNLRGGMPSPQVVAGQIVNPHLRQITGNAFDIAAGAQALAKSGPEALHKFRMGVIDGTINAAKAGARGVAERYGIDYQAAARIYSGQVTSGANRMFSRKPRKSYSGAKAVNRVAGLAHDDVLAQRRETPVGAASDDPTQPAKAIDQRVLLAAAAVLVLLLVK